MRTLFIKYCHSHDQRASLESILQNENLHDIILNMDHVCERVREELKHIKDLLSQHVEKCHNNK